MAVITRSQLAEIAPFAVPFSQNVSIASVSHSYQSNCDSFIQIEQFTLVITLGYLVMILVWSMTTWYVYGQWNQSNMINGTSENLLQKGLTIIPILKMLKSLSFALYAGNCPWNDPNPLKYMIMAIVTLTTIYQTVYVGFLLLLSRSWTILYQQLSRRDEFQLLLLTSIVYTTYSAYFFSLNVNFMKELIQIFIVIMYMVIDYISIKNNRQIRDTIHEHRQLVPPESPLYQALTLKYEITQGYNIVAGMFYLYEIFIHAFLPLLIAEDQNIYATVFQQVYEFCMIGTLLWIYRPR